MDVNCFFVLQKERSWNRTNFCLIQLTDKYHKWHNLKSIDRIKVYMQNNNFWFYLHIDILLGNLQTKEAELFNNFKHYALNFYNINNIKIIKLKLCVCERGKYMYPTHQWIFLRLKN